MFESIIVSRNDVEQFMNEVKPKTAVIEMSSDADICFNFGTYEDFSKAQAWVYAHYEFEVLDNKEPIGCIYYHKNCGYAFYCDMDEHEEQGFSSPAKAEDALWDYYDSIAEVA